MKWLGQHIVDLIARFRSDVYLEDISTGTIASGSHLGLDSNNKIVKAVDGGGDLTGITAGVGLSGTSLTGPIPTLNVDAAQTQITSIGTIATGVWEGTDVEVAHGGTGASTLGVGSVLVGNGTGSIVSTHLQFVNDAGETDTSTLSILSNQDLGDRFTIATTTYGATTLTTIDDDLAAAHFEIAADGNIILDAAGDIELENDTTVTGNFAVNGDYTVLTSSTANRPQIQIRNTADDATPGTIAFMKDRGAAAVNNDDIGRLDFIGENDAEEAIYYGRILVEALEVDDTDEAGKMILQVAESNGSVSGLTTGVLIEGSDNTTDGEVNVTIAAGAASVTTVAGTLTMGSTATLTNAGLVAVANQSNITGVGTISSGVWNGTAIASDQQKHLMHYVFSGYAEGNGSTYEIPVVAHDAQAPFEHNTSTGADGLDAITVQNQVRTNGKVMPTGGTLKKWTGWATGENTSGTTNIALFKVTPANDSTSTVSPVLLKEIAFSAGGNSRSFAIAETSFSVDVAAGDVVFTGIKGVNNKDVYFTSTLEVEF